MPAPSRPPTVAPTVTASIPIDDTLPSIDPMVAAARLARGLDRVTLSALIAFVESPRDGAITLCREDGEIAVDTPIRRSRAAASH